jgi:hypothetical protein
MNPQDRNKAIALSVAVLFVFGFVGKTVYSEIGGGKTSATPPVAESVGEPVVVANGEVSVATPPLGSVTPVGLDISPTMGSLDPFEASSSRTGGSVQRDSYAPDAPERQIQGPLARDWEAGPVTVSVGAQAATSVKLQGLVSGQPPIALLLVGDEQVLLATGSTVNGMRLIETKGETAVIEMNGVRHTLEVGEAISLDSN